MALPTEEAAALLADKLGEQAEHLAAALRRLDGTAPLPVAKALVALDAMLGKLLKVEAALPPPARPRGGKP
jgi:hypothetical protein